jgi:hypothetical protein
MRDRPDGATLLAFAREVLLRELAPLLPEERRADADAIAGAMAIAERELRNGEALLTPCRDALTGLYGAGDPDVLLERLARDIRAGDFDAPGPRREAVRKLLWSMTRLKLHESNPDFLRAAESD